MPKEEKVEEEVKTKKKTKKEEKIKENLPEADGRTAPFFERIAAKAFDILIAAILIEGFGFAGALLGLFYVLIADSFNNGQSLGKKLLGLRVLSTIKEDEICGLRESIIRNSPLGAIVVSYMVIGWIPYFGSFLVFVLGVAIIAYEVMSVYNDPELGIRFGDKIAETRVIRDEE